MLDPTYIISFVIAAILSLIGTYFIKKYSEGKKVYLKEVRDRDIHKKPVPKIGGIVVFWVFWITVFVIYFIKPKLLNFSEVKILGIDQNLLGLFVASLVWFVAGIYDDLKNLKPWKKLLVQFVCGIIIVAFGIKIWWVANPLGGLNIVLGSWTYFLVPIWVVLIMNVLNWFDGIDGLTPSISIVSLVVMFYLAISPVVNQPSTALLCAVLAGAIVGFFPYNWNPASIFLGDLGSGFLGLCLATFAIMSGAKLATAFLVLGIPIIDAMLVIFTRMFKRKSIFSADKSHLHHRFLKAGFSVKATVFTLSSISLLFGIIALNTQTLDKLKAGMWLVILMVVILIGLYIGNLHEVRRRSKK